MMIANRTKDDELVLIHLGDSLWKERNDVHSSLPHIILINYFFLVLQMLRVLIFNFLVLKKIMVQITAAHICYLIAEASFEPYSDSSRLCLVGADHFKFPRTYVSPDAIQVVFYSLQLHSLSNLQNRHILLENEQFIYYKFLLQSANIPI